MIDASIARGSLPSVDRLVRSPACASLIAEYGAPEVCQAMRTILDRRRAELVSDGGVISTFSEDDYADFCARLLAERHRQVLGPVFNLTGTVLHTNLGRAPMPECAADAVKGVMTRPVNLEFDLREGKRGERDAPVEEWLKRLTGAESAVVVNNNAAAVYLVLNTLASRKEVVVSRGELIEIGGSFRIPEIMTSAGCKLREVGTTNRTHLRDFENAISPKVAALLKVHASNYAICGFTAAACETDLAALARAHSIPFVVDLGSGTLIDLSLYGLPREPTPQQALAAGADVVTFSGDKLLGGPQAGLIVGRKDFIARIARNPMKRALRADKMTLAALESVLRLYANPARLREKLPVIKWLVRPVGEIEAQARRALDAVRHAIGPAFNVAIGPCESQIGSGSLPLNTIASAGIWIKDSSKGGKSQLSRLAAKFRALPIPVVGRLNDGTFMMDFRCLDEEAQFIAQLALLAKN